MTLNIQADPVPLRIDAAGAIRVGETRVLLDLVIHAYQDGHAPEVIVHKYPTLQLGDVYAVIAYYLRHRSEVDPYLRQCEEEAVELRRKIEADQPPGLSKDELLKRWAERKKDSPVSPLAW